mmetsp:Transcript_40576/g.114917  ORF Transcript_40576/g.114917 Transcript_40576/m.114917 type:complete len:445 (+) Transcript_40576:1497-2831(+)
MMHGLLKANDAIVKAASAALISQNASVQVSADELLPLFIASLVITCPAKLATTLEYLLTFHTEGDLHGKAGYMLAMLEASTEFLKQCRRKGVVGRAEAIPLPPPDVVWAEHQRRQGNFDLAVLATGSSVASELLEGLINGGEAGNGPDRPAIDRSLSRDPRPVLFTAAGSSRHSEGTDGLQGSSPEGSQLPSAATADLLRPAGLEDPLFAPLTEWQPSPAYIVSPALQQLQQQRRPARGLAKRRSMPGGMSSLQHRSTSPPPAPLAGVSLSQSMPPSGAEAGQAGEALDFGSVMEALDRAAAEQQLEAEEELRHKTLGIYASPRPQYSSTAVQHGTTAVQQYNVPLPDATQVATATALQHVPSLRRMSSEPSSPACSFSASRGGSSGDLSASPAGALMSSRPPAVISADSATGRGPRTSLGSFLSNLRQSNEPLSINHAGARGP